MKITRQGGSYYTNYKNFTRLRPKFQPSGQRRLERDLSGLVWEDATMEWDNLVATWDALS